MNQVSCCLLEGWHYEKEEDDIKEEDNEEEDDNKEEDNNEEEEIWGNMDEWMALMKNENKYTPSESSDWDENVANKC